MKKVLNVRRIGFYGKTADDRSPESLAFAACMTSLAETLGEDYPIVTIRGHGMKYTKRTANDAILAASGMAFALLWEKTFCPSSFDVTQAAGTDETVRRAFAWLGYSYEQINRENTSPDEIRTKIRASIDAGKPVLVYNLFDVPECAIVAGYNNDGEILIGWSHFQGEYPEEDGGMFHLSGWEKDFWFTVFPGEKIGRSINDAEILSFGKSILDMTEVDGYQAGAAAYDEWISAIRNVTEENAPALYKYYHDLMFNLAELRAWGANFVADAGAPEAAKCFNDIHDLCWKADRVVGAKHEKALLDPAKREELISVIKEMKEKDREASSLL